MSKQTALLPALSLLFLTLLVSSQAAAEHSLISDGEVAPNEARGERVGDLYRGDLGSEIGIGCANAEMTSGGPNYFAVCVAGASIPPPYFISECFYNAFSNWSPTITALTFRVWAGGEVPGATIGQQSGLDFTDGDHTATISPPILVGDSEFFFGPEQPQESAGYRVGLDTSSGSPVQSFIKAPACGEPEWVTLDAIGFPGNWVMSVSVGSPTPVELGGSCGSQPTPVESATWGEIKSRSW